MADSSQRTRLLFLLHTLTLGGTERHLLRLAQALDPKHFELTLLVLTDRTSNDLKAQFQAVKNLEIICGPFGINNPRTFFWAFDYMANHTFDFIIPFQPRCQFIAALFSHTHHHQGLIISERGDRLFRDIWLGIFDRPLILPAARRLIANSYYGCELLRKRGVDSSRIAVIPNGLDFRAVQTTAYQRARTALLPKGKIVVGYCGRLEKVKCLDLLILAAAELEKSTLEKCLFVLVGEGSERHVLEGLVKSKGLHDHFLFLGFQENPLEIMGQFNIGVLCSAHEGFPNVILEMLALAVPVIATAITSIPEIIVHEKTGYLIAANSVTPLAQAISFFIANPEVAKACGLAGQKLVSEKYSQERVVADYISLFESIPQTPQINPAHASTHY